MGWDLVVDDNAEVGIFTHALTLHDSEVLRNGVATGVDITSDRRPRLIDSVCGVSNIRGGGAGESWGVCGSD